MKPGNTVFSDMGQSSPRFSGVGGWFSSPTPYCSTSYRRFGCPPVIPNWFAFNDLLIALSCGCLRFYPRRGGEAAGGGGEEAAPAVRRFDGEAVRR